MTNQSKQLDPHNDAYVIVEFESKDSAQLRFHPYNVSPIQMLLAAELMRQEGLAVLNGERIKQAVREAMKPDTPKIALPGDVRIMPKNNA